eukprot:579625-Pyramimonas_sp.AAC.3
MDGFTDGFTVHTATNAMTNSTTKQSGTNSGSLHGMSPAVSGDRSLSLFPSRTRRAQTADVTFGKALEGSGGMQGAEKTMILTRLVTFSFQLVTAMWKP